MDSRALMALGVLAGAAIKVTLDHRSSKPEESRVKAPSVRPTRVQREFARDIYMPEAGSVAHLDLAAPVQATHVPTRSSLYGEYSDVEAAPTEHPDPLLAHLQQQGAALQEQATDDFNRWMEMDLEDYAY